MIRFGVLHFVLGFLIPRWFYTKAADMEATRGHRGSAKLRIEAFTTLRVLVAKVSSCHFQFLILICFKLVFIHVLLILP